jgi:hypothetical protein
LSPNCQYFLHFFHKLKNHNTDPALVLEAKTADSRRVEVVLEAEGEVVVVLVGVRALGNDADVVAVRLVPGVEQGRLEPILKTRFGRNLQIYGRNLQIYGRNLQIYGRNLQILILDEFSF